MTSYLIFAEHYNPGRVTKVWDVYSKVNPAGPPLGHIYYRPSWRKYVYASEDADYDVNCLTDIINFLNEHKDDRQ